MKKITIVLLLLCFFISNMSAHIFSGYFNDIQSDGPIHPLNFRITRSLDLDSIFLCRHVELGQDFEKEFGRLEFYFAGKVTHSEDGLIDTVFGDDACNSFVVRHYSEDNKPLFQSDDFKFRSEPSEYTKQFYKYDDEGRLIQMTYYRGIKNPDGSKEEENLESDSYFDYSNIQMTENGYIYPDFKVEYVLDDLGRVIHIKNLESEDKYVEYIDGKKYRYGDTYYFYTDSSCTSFGYYHVADDIIGLPDRWLKHEHIFNEKGDLKMRTASGSLDGENWAITYKYEFDYRYLNKTNSANDQTSNELLENASQTQAYGIDDAIMIIAENDATAQVYNMHGQLVIQQKVSSGKNSIRVSKGFYIVNVEGASFKIFVR